MNTLKTLLLALTLTYSTLSLAYLSADYELPIMGDEDMTILDSTGSFNYIEKVGMTLNKKVQAIVPTSITLYTEVSEMVPVSIVKYTIIDVKKDFCGSYNYVAEVQQGPTYMMDGPSKGSIQKIFLTDHSNRYCEDLKRYNWEATIFRGTGYGAETMDIAGHPMQQFHIN